MRITETLVFYLTVGIAVSVAMYVAEGSRTPRRLGFLVATSLLFWPLYLPVLLSSRSARRSEVVTSPPSLDAMATAIAQVELELQGALASLDGWPEATLAHEKGRMGELRTALTTQATRIREMDALLSRTTSEPANLQSAADSLDAAPLERWQKSQRAREQNLARLADVRRQTHADLMATLAWIRELVSMIHLAKFTGAPASRTEELVAQIAAAVEGISLVGCPEPDDSPHALDRMAVGT